jgi:hypothetical protein
LISDSAFAVKFQKSINRNQTSKIKKVKYSISKVPFYELKTIYPIKKQEKSVTFALNKILLKII